jgi:DUF917 family protein
MAVELDLEAARKATYGGLVMGAGGGGLERGLKAAEAVFAVGAPTMVTLDELDDDDQVVVMTGVGAPGVGTTRQLSGTTDSLRALDMVLEAWEGPGRIVGTMGAHPGAGMAAGWLANAIKGLFVVDAQTNGRGHPTVAMGGMGLAGRLDVEVFQAASGGDPEFMGHIEVVVKGPLGKGSSILHHASGEVGGSIRASRGPFSVGFLRTNGAVGAVSYCIRLGEAMLAAEGKGGDAMIEAILETTGGRELGRGPLTKAGTTLEHAWDVGILEVDSSGSKLEVIVVNEFMGVDVDGERVSTYPDLIVTLDPESGMPTAAARMGVGEEVVVVSVPKSSIPLGAGVWDAVVYEDAERLAGREITRYALEGAPA